MEISVRGATAGDYNSMCELFDEIDTLHRDNLPHLFRKPDGAPREPEYYADLLEDENVILLVAEAGGDLVGFVHAIVKEAPDFPVLVPRRYLLVDGIVVRSGFQKQGIGKVLMDEVREQAIARDATSMELSVYDFNETAISFYESLGFQTLSRKMRKELKEDKTAR